MPRPHAHTSESSATWASGASGVTCYQPFREQCSAAAAADCKSLRSIAAGYFVPLSTSRHCSRKAVRSRGMTFATSALCAHSRCLICSARRFIAASRYSGATVAGSTSFSAKAGTVIISNGSVTEIKHFKISSFTKQVDLDFSFQFQTRRRDGLTAIPRSISKQAKQALCPKLQDIQEDIGLSSRDCPAKAELRDEMVHAPPSGEGPSRSTVVGAGSGTRNVPPRSTKPLLRVMIGSA